MSSARIEDLKLYANVNTKTKSNILIGNGFSIGVNPRFAYPSLRQVALKEHFFAFEDDEMFNLLGTYDFESVLRRLGEAEEVVRLLNQPFGFLTRKRRVIRSALAKSVRYIHPRYENIESNWLETVAAELRTYKKVFTTNYDFLLYWTIASVDFRGFTDFFWSGDLTFDPLNLENWRGTTELHYLHGTLFLFLDNETGKVTKIRRSIVNRLMDHVPGMSVFSTALPLFISEGTSPDKLKSIAESQYLSVCLQRFSGMKTGLTIFGHALNGDADKHLIDAINANRRLDNVAISVYIADEVNQSNAVIVQMMNSYLDKFQPFVAHGGEVEFFAHASSPFAYGLPDTYEYELPLPF